MQHLAALSVRNPLRRIHTRALTFDCRFPRLLCHWYRAMRQSLLWAACLLSAFSSAAEAQPIRFVRESLQFSLAVDSFSFSGVYYFDNPGPTPVDRSILYPFVLSGSPPDSTSIVEVQSGKVIPVTAARSGVLFAAAIPPFSTKAYRIAFAQRAPNRSLEYILKTTAWWGQPLDRASLTIEMPENIAIKQISLKPDSVHSAGARTRYAIEREHFLPKENLIVRWERKKP